MAVAESKGALAKAVKDLFARWNDVKSIWADGKAQEFEDTFLVQIEQDVRNAQGALDRIDAVLMRIKSDCE